MNFEPTIEQKILREAVGRFVAKNCPLNDVRRWDRDGEFPEAVHRAMAEAGYPAMMVPEAYGGLGKIGRAHV